MLDGTVLITADLHGSIDALQGTERGEPMGHTITHLRPPMTPLSLLPKPVTDAGTRVRPTYAFSSRIPTPTPVQPLAGRTPQNHGDFFFELPLRPEEQTSSSADHPCTTLEIDASGIISINGGSPAHGRSRWGKTYALLKEDEASIHRVSDGSRCFSLTLTDR